MKRSESVPTLVPKEDQDDETYEIEHEDYKGFPSEEERHNFISKLYGILTTQLMFTVAVVLLINTDEVIRETFFDYSWISIILSILGGSLYFVLVLSSTARKKRPYNTLLVISMTTSFAFVAGIVSAQYELVVIWYSIAVTAVVTVTMTLAGRYASCSITNYGTMFTLSFILITIYGLVASAVTFYYHATLLYVIYTFVVFLFFAAFIAYVTQHTSGWKKGYDPKMLLLLKGGKSFGCVVFSSVMLYISIYTFFFNFMRFLAACVRQ